MSKKKNKGGRPTKLTATFLEAAEEVLEEDSNSLLTDEDLVILINDKLEEPQQITKRTFENWKAKSKEDKELDEIGKRFFRLLKKALIKEKRNLLAGVKEGSSQWQSKAWILERKFDEWNIKHKSDITSGDKPIPLIDYTNVRNNNSNQEDTGSE